MNLWEETSFLCKFCTKVNNPQTGTERHGSLVSSGGFGHFHEREDKCEGFPIESSRDNIRTTKRDVFRVTRESSPRFVTRVTPTRQINEFLSLRFLLNYCQLFTLIINIVSALSTSSVYCYCPIDMYRQKQPNTRHTHKFHSPKHVLPGTKYDCPLFDIKTLRLPISQ